MATTKTDGTIEHADFGGGWIQIFQTGSYGDKGKFDEADLDRVVSNYKPDLHEAPAVVGHPKDNAPAYGWTSGLKRDGDKLLAKFSQVDPAFEEAVKAGRYKKRSAAFYLDDQGRITNLRHVGFLGALPPEVKGLQDLKFADNGRKFTEVDFGEEAVVAQEKTFKEQMKEFFAEVFGGGDKGAGGQKTFSEDDVKKIATEAAAVASAPLEAQLKELKETTAKQTTAFAEREKLIATGEVKQRAIAAATKLRASGKWVPAFDRMGLTQVFEELAPLTSTIEFGEGDQKKKLSPLETLVTFLEGLPKIIPAGTVFNGSLAPTAGGKATGDPLTDAAKARQKEKKITFGEALAEVAREQPELTRAIAGGV